MESSQDRKFPSAFGTSPDNFLEQYESLIYKIIYEQTRENSGFEAEDFKNSLSMSLKIILGGCAASGETAAQLPIWGEFFVIFYTTNIEKQ